LIKLEFCPDVINEELRILVIAVGAVKATAALLLDCPVTRHGNPRLAVQ
jgi:hypothetical protein